MSGELPPRSTMVMSPIESTLEKACASVPGVVTGALVLLSERLLIGGVGDGSMLDREPLVRLAVRLVAERLPLPGATSFIEYAFVNDDQFVVVLRGRRFPELALALACRRDVNLSLVMSTTRMALGQVESSLDASAWKV